MPSCAGVEIATTCICQPGPSLPSLTRHGVKCHRRLVSAPSRELVAPWKQSGEAFANSSNEGQE
eukprot:3592522-Amphidinium_carterae.1